MIVYKEIPVLIPELKISGKGDGIIEIEGKRYLLEIKTMNPFSYQKLVKVPDYYLVQTGIYMKGLSIEDTIFVFENKAFNENTPIIVKYDGKFLAPYVAILDKASRHIDRNKLPPKLTDVKDIKELCGECEWSTLCKVADKFKEGLTIADCL